MKTEAKGLLLLLGTLSLGILLGAAGSGTINRERNRDAEEIRRPNGFVEHMLEVIHPRDSAQRAAILPAIQHTGERNREIMHTAHTQLRAALDSLRTEIGPRLDAEQRRRLQDFARMPPPPPPPPGARRPPPPPRRDGPPPPREDGPPPRDDDRPPPGEAPPPRDENRPPPGEGAPPPEGRGPPGQDRPGSPGAPRR